MGCSGLRSITIPNSVTSIGLQAFNGCSGLTSLNIPYSVTAIGDLAFADCSSLTEITVANGNNVYDSRNGCNAIIESANNTLICGCMNTIIPNTVTSIYIYAFEYCSGLTSITIPNSVNSIGWDAFHGCSALTSITIGNSVSSIDDAAFANCSRLISIISNATTPPIISSSAFFQVPDTIPVYVPCGSVAAYRAANGWSNFSNIQGIGNSHTDTVYACDSYTWHGRTFTESTDTATYRTTNAAGCDSIVTLHLFLFHNSNTGFTVKSCDGEGYLWSNNGNYRNFTRSGTYYSSYYTAEGCPSVDTLFLTVGHNSSYTDVQTACNSYTWIDGITYTASNNTAKDTLTNAEGCDSIVTLNLTINHGAMIALQANNTDICEGDSVTLTASGATRYAWNGGTPETSSTKTFAPTATTTYWVEGDVSGGAACSATDSVTVTVHQYPALQITTNAENNTICYGQRVNILLSGADLYKFDRFPENSISRYPQQPTGTARYPVQARFRNSSCIVYDTVTITVIQPPTVSITPDTICAGDTVTIQATSPTAVRYIWSDSITGAQRTVCSYSDTAFMVTAIDSHGCSRTASHTVRVLQYHPVSLASSPFCHGATSITLTATSDAGAYFRWMDDTMGLVTTNVVTRTPDNSRNYTVQTANSNGMCVSEASIHVVEYPLPNVRLTGETAVCKYDEVTLRASGARLYAWNGDTSRYSDQDTMTVILPSTQTYYVYGMDEHNCVNVDSLTINVYNYPTNFYITSSRGDICRGDTVHIFANGARLFTANVNTPWLTSDSSYITTLDTTTNIMMYGATDNTMCYDSATLIIRVHEYPNTVASADRNCYYSGDTAVITASGATEYSTNGTTFSRVNVFHVVLHQDTDIVVYGRNQIGLCVKTDTLHLTIGATTEITACDNYTWTSHSTSNTYTASGTYTNNITANGCIVTDTLLLTINHSTAETETVTAYNRYTWHGRTFTESTDTATYRTTNAEGCDSIVTLNLTIIIAPPIYDTVDSNICTVNLPFTWGGHRFLEDGSYTATFRGQHGEDSIVTMNVHVHNASRAYHRDTVYRRDLPWTAPGGTVCTNDTNFLIIGENQWGCDSLTVYSLIVLRDYYVWCDTTICSNNLPITWNGIHFTEGGTRHTTYRASDGRDSIVTYHLNVLSTVESTDSAEACSSYTWHGRTFTANTDTATFRTIIDTICNSVTLHLTVYNDSSNSYTVTVDDSYTWINHGTSHTYTLSGTYTNNYTTADGCNSTDTLHLIVNRIFTVNVLSSDTTMGNATVTGGSNHNAGDTVMLTAIPNCGYAFSQWSDGVTTNPRTLIARSDTTIIAQFNIGTTKICQACSTGQILYYTLDCNNNTATVTCPGTPGHYTAWNGYVRPTGNITIPDSVTHNGTTYSVTSIGQYAFCNCSGLTGTLTIPGSVTSIGEDAFCDCSGFTGSLTIPGSVITIGNYAFYGCKGFNGTLTIPNSVTSIGYGAFYLCWHFTGSLIIPCSVTSIGDDAFGFCYGFNGTLTIPNSVTSIGRGVFCFCYGFTGSLTIPNTITSIGYRAFNDCSGFSGPLTIPNSVTSIDDKAFMGCRGFTGPLTIPNSVTYIGDRTFDGCSGFTGSLTIPSSVTFISSSAFYGCSGFTSVTIPGYVDTIVQNAFGGCTGLTSITSLASVPPRLIEVDEYVFSGISTTLPIYVPCGSVAAYRTDNSWNRFSNIQGMSVYTDTTIMACESYTWASNGNTYTASGTYTNTVTADGCDVTDTLHLTINRGTRSTETDTACGYYTWHGRTFATSTTTPTYTTTNAAGCDSTVTLHLTVYRDSSSAYFATVDDSYTWTNHGSTHTYTQSGTYTNRYTTADGCVSTDTLYLTVNRAFFTVRTASSNPSMGRTAVVGNSRVEQGSTATVRATANPGHLFLRWSNGATRNPYTFTVTQDTLLTATFVAMSYEVTVLNGNPGRGIVSGTGMARHGARHTIAAAPNHGYRFSHWSDGDSTASRVITVTHDTTLTAYFDTTQFHVDVRTSNYAHGTVSGSGDYDYRSYATLTATPNRGYVFHHWSDGDSVNPRRLLVLRDTTLTAYFVQGVPRYTLTATSADLSMGSVSGGGTYEEGTTVTIAANASSGYEFASWTDGVTTNPRSVTILSDTAFTATFRAVYVPQDYTVTITSNDESLGRVSGSGTYREGSTAYISAYPSAHCHFVRWSDGNATAQRTLTVTSDITLTATFAPDSVEIVARANDGGLGRVAGGGLYAIGDEATLTATPNSGSRFLRWSTGEREQTITITVRYAATYTAYFERTTQGIDEAESGELRAWSHAMTIHVAGLTGEPLRVYDVTGRLVAERTAAHGDMVIPVTHPGLYLVQTGTVTHKVLTR